MNEDESIVLRDRNGQPRIILSAHESAPHIALMGSDKSEMLIEMRGADSHIHFRSGGAPAAVVSYKDAFMSVIVFDREGKSFGTMVGKYDGTSYTLMMLDRDQNTVASHSGAL